MAQGSEQMQRLVDAFKGLAFEGNTGTHLADVESIVNSYFPKSTEDNDTAAGSSARASASPARSASASNRSAAAVSTVARDALADVDAAPLRESPIRHRPDTGDQGMSLSMMSGDSLKAWGEAVGHQPMYATAVHHAPHGSPSPGAGEGNILSSPPQDDDDLYGPAGEPEDDFYARSLEWRRRQTASRLQHKKTQQERETEDCTWAPRINAKPGAAAVTNSGKVMYGRVEDRLHASEASRRHRLEAERRRKQEEETMNCTFQPKLNKNASSAALSTTVQSRYMNGVIPQLPADADKPDVKKETSARPAMGKASDDVFARLHSAGLKKDAPGSSRRSRSAASRGEPARAGAPVLFTTFNPTKPPSKQGKTAVNLNLSCEEIEATDRELADIEALLNHRLYAGAPNGFHIATVDSNYMDSDEEGEAPPGDVSLMGRSDAGSARSKVDFNTFLVRQNAFEERRRANLMFIEADVAPSHHPVIRPQSQRIKSKVATGRAAAARGAPLQLQQRLRTLITTAWETKGEIRKLHDKGEQLIKKLDVINNAQEGAGARGGQAGQLKRELRSLRTTERSSIALEGLKPLQILPQDPLLQKVFKSEQAKLIDSLFKGKLRRMSCGSDLTADDTQSGASAAAKQPDAATLHGYIREMLEVRAGLTEVKVRCCRVRDAMAVEISTSVDAMHGCVPWETLAKMEFSRGERAVVEQGEKPKPLPAVVGEGDRVIARREPWQAWGKGAVVAFEDGGERAEVLLDGTSKPQWFPATRDCLMPEPGETPTFIPKIREQYLQTLIKTREVVQVRVGGLTGEDLPARVVSQEGKNWTVAVPDAAGKLTKKIVVGAEAIRTERDAATSEHYGAAYLDTYTERLEEDKRRREEKQRRVKTEQVLKETSACTHTPQINAVPQYISRIAHSMQILRGETTAQ
eukprot:TRINITY_DN24896_c0_g1_i1.p1 TRINITY_DN24896_c0_g1~~TRINITY_DN24896_c0_g1_i1.p1  ORF type:complete len:930 (+),score=399.86 TRINITY_DN24896_c0_g1_i1:36-2792(+)